MIIDRNAVYENGVLRLETPLDLPEHARVHLSIAVSDEAGSTPLGRKLRSLRAALVADSQTGLGWSEIEDEVDSRRGGWREAE